MNALINPAEVHAAFQTYAKDIGPKASFHLAVGAAPMHCVCGCYPNGYSAKGGGLAEYFSVSAETWDRLLIEFKSAWAARSDQNAENKTQALALKIIELTDQRGECTDAMLRADFDAVEVERYGADAVERANKMAERGPFEIIRLAGTNARAA